jgi:Pyruvate/2-oxoacid:ferredoxin oxidoreductase delta subunit
MFDNQNPEAAVQTTIYCYSATGNSLVIARTIAGALGDTEVLPIARYRKGGAEPAARVGIVFPIHAWGPPRTVTEFVQKLDVSSARYVFAVASCGGCAAGTLAKMRRAIRRNGGDLHAGFIVRSTGYMESSGGEAPMIELVRRLSGKPFPTERERLPQVIEAVRTETKSRPERNALAGTVLGNFFHGMAGKAFAKMDSGYHLQAECAACGTCGRVCPRGNVRLEDGRPVWHHDCEFCGACATWCTRNAIVLSGTSGQPRRHHAQVTAVDLAWA